MLLLQKKDGKRERERERSLPSNLKIRPEYSETPSYSDDYSGKVPGDGAKRRIFERESASAAKEGREERITGG